MRSIAFFIIASACAVGCSDYLSPSVSGTTYALARVGTTPLPVFLGENGALPLLLADTIRLVQERPHRGDSILEHVSVLRTTNTQISRSETEHLYTLEGGLLGFDECPIGSFCAALVAAPRIFQVVGDSLFEIQILGRPQYVYGRVRF